MLVLYDIPSQFPGTAWSPHIWKTRVALLYKGLPFRNEFLEYPEIEPFIKKLGLRPTGKWKDGKDQYTFPLLHDPSTGKYVNESIEIAEYLDDTYPDKPLLFPFGRAPVYMFEEYFAQTALSKMLPIVIPHIGPKLNPASYEHFRYTREIMLGGKLEDVSPPGPKRDAQILAMKEGYAKMAALYGKNGDGNQLFLFGDTISYADCVMLGFMVWMRTVLGSESTEWKDFMAWDGGRWGKFVEATKKYQTPEFV